MRRVWSPVFRFLLFGSDSKHALEIQSCQALSVHLSFRWTAEHLSPWKQCSHTQPLYPSSPPPASQQVWDNDTVASWCHTHATVQFVVLSCPVPAAVQRLPCSRFPPVCRQLYSSDICKWLCYSWCNSSLEDPSCWGVFQSCEATAVSPECARASLQAFF